MTVIDHPSNNHEPRANDMVPTMVVLHGTWLPDAAQSLACLVDGNSERPNGRVSAHYLIDTDGTMYKLVDEDRRAWHAGKSHWRGIDDVNSASIGIELQNDSKQPYDPRQIAALIELLRGIVARHGIAPENVVGHSDVAPGRKDDPGAHFPWDALVDAGLAKRP